MQTSFPTPSLPNKPHYIDNFNRKALGINSAVSLPAGRYDITLDDTQPGSPYQNNDIERFNRT